MKTHCMLTGLAMAGLGLTFIAKSQEPAPADEAKGATTRKSSEVDPFDPDASPPKPMLVQVQVEYLEMSHEALTKLLFLAKPTSSDATKLREQVQEMVGKNEAKVIETQICTAKSGQKATCESIHEFMYPTEYEPPRFPGPSHVIKKADQPEIAAGLGFEECPATPTAFETRNVGSTLEIEPTIGEEGRFIDLRFVPEFIWHTGNNTWHEGKDRAGNPYRIQMPDFYTLRFNTSLTCINGQYNLAGVVSPKDDKGDTDTSRKVMVFVKCDILEVK